MAGTLVDQKKKKEEVLTGRENVFKFRLDSTFLLVQIIMSYCIKPTSLGMKLCIENCSSISSE